MTAKNYKTSFLIEADGDGGIRVMAAAEDGLDKLNDQVGRGEKANKKYSKSSKDSESNLLKLSKGAATAAAGVAAAGTAIATAIATIAVANSELVKQQVLTADSLGVSTEGLMAQAYAAGQYNVEFEALGNVMKDFTTKVTEFAEIGTGEAADFFEKLNLDVEEFAALAPDELMARIGQELEGLNRNEKILFLDQLGSDDAVKLVDVIGQLSEMREEALALGVALSDVDARGIYLAAQGMDRVQAIGQGAKNQLSVALAPVIADISQRLVGVAVESGGVQDAMNKMVDGTVIGVGAVLDVLQDGRYVLKLSESGWVQLGAMATSAMAESAESVAMLINDFLEPFLELIADSAERWMFLADSLADNPLVPESWRDDLKGMADGLADFSVSTRDFSLSADDIINLNDSMQASVEKINEELTAMAAAPDASDDLLAWLAQARADLKITAEAATDSTETMAETFDDGLDEMREGWDGYVDDMVDSFARGTGSVEDIFSDLLGGLQNFALRSAISIPLGVGGTGGILGFASGSAAASGSSTGLGLGDVLSGATFASNLAAGNGALMSGVGGLATGLHGVGAAGAADGLVAGANWLNAATPGGMLGAAGIAIVTSMVVSEIIDGMTGQNRNMTLGVSAGSRPGDDLVRAVTAASGLELYGISRRTDEGATNQFLDLLAGMDSTLTAIAADAGYSIDLSGSRLPGGSAQPGRFPGVDQSFFGIAENGEVSQAEIERALQEALTQFLLSWFGEASEQLPDAIADQLGSLSGVSDDLVAGFAEIFQFEQIKESMVDLFGSSSESAILQRNLNLLQGQFQSLTGDSLPLTRDAMQAYITGLLEQADANRETLQALYQLNPELGVLYDGLEGVGEALAARAAELRDFNRSVQDEIYESLASPTEVALRDIRREMNEMVRVASELGASEADLANVRSLAGVRLTNLIEGLEDSVASLVDQYWGSELQDQIEQERLRIADLQEAEDTLYEKEMKRYQDAIAAESRLADFQQSLLLGDLSPLTPAEREAEALAQFNAAIASGNADAATDLASTYLGILQGNAASGAAYQSGFQYVNSSISALLGGLDTSNPGSATTVGSSLLDSLLAAQEQQRSAAQELERAALAESLKTALAELGLARGVDIADLAAEFGIDINTLNSDLVGGLDNLPGELGDEIEPVIDAAAVMNDETRQLLNGIAFGLTALSTRQHADALELLDEMQSMVQATTGVQTQLSTMDQKSDWFETIAHNLRTQIRDATRDTRDNIEDGVLIRVA